MNKSILFALVAGLGLIINSGPVLATSGACSGHLGVNCRAGADYDGSVICNDGWEDSSVSFYSMSECDAPIVNRCFMPYPVGCTSGEAYSSKEAGCNATRAIEARSGILNTPMSHADACQAELTRCREEINTYNSRMQEYYDCLMKPATQSYYKTPSANTAPPSTPQAPSDTFLQYDCERKLGGYAKYDSATQSCSCWGGRTLNDAKNECVDQETPRRIEYAPISVSAPPAPAVNQLVARDVTLHFPDPPRTPSPSTKATLPRIDYVNTLRRANVRASRSAKAKIIGVTNVKTNYQLLEEGNDWVKVKFGIKVGWIMKSLVVIK